LINQRAADIKANKRREKMQKIPQENTKKNFGRRLGNQ
jgi:hypothetical protein